MNSACHPGLKPIEIFYLLFTQDILQYIVDGTNKYCYHILLGKHLTKRSLYSNWQLISLNEMKHFIAIIINMGIIQLKDIKDYWGKHFTLNIPFFCQVMSRDRFLQIFNMLHVGEIQSNTRRDKIQPFIDLMHLSNFSPTIPCSGQYRKDTGFECSYTSTDPA